MKRNGYWQGISKKNTRIPLIRIICIETSSKSVLIVVERVQKHLKGLREREMASTHFLLQRFLLTLTRRKASRTMDYSHTGQQVIDIVMPTYITEPAEDERFAFCLLLKAAKTHILSIFSLPFEQVLPFPSASYRRSDSSRVFRRQGV